MTLIEIVKSEDVQALENYCIRKGTYKNVISGMESECVNLNRKMKDQMFDALEELLTAI